MTAIGPGLYLHVPFCQSKCSYCSFSSFVGSPTDIRDYYQAVLGQLKLLSRRPPWDRLPFATIFFGGGTPSILPRELPAELLGRLARAFRLEPQAEVSMEINPATISPREMNSLRRAGFNRLSIGVQSLDDATLALIGRGHNREEALRAFQAARAAGFSDLSLDLIYGLPGQDAAQWRQTLETVLALEPDHLSLYELTLEEGTPLTRAVARGELRLPGEEEVLAMMEQTRIILGSSPLERYEISNYARPGHRCRHNLNYWHNGSYLGLGPAAVSGHGGRRWTGIKQLSRFCRAVAAGTPAWGDQETLDQESYFRESVVIGLRLIRGVDLEALHRRFGIDGLSYYGQTLSRLVELQLVELKGSRLRLSAKGKPLANQVMAELV
ncbi:radical SAM family heme chaperone HemW [Desulfogranum mediterraneum]|uniref:radical SAM family heme chaperone HemW n=1 Tax=Desulfogranum mediterraneum TaxID=160661 RepID=UPI000412CFB3|nr:radical SAM family heme chaperone HemW [Desulfogranum mediterraneum]